MNTTLPRYAFTNRLVVTIVAAMAISYCLIVIWYVATFPDVGVRCLLPSDSTQRTLTVTQFTHSSDDCSGTPIEPGFQIFRFGGRPATNFLAFIESVAQLRTASIPPGGQLLPGATPGEDRNTPPLVEIAPAESGVNQTPRRMVKLEFRKPLDGQTQSFVDESTYVAIKPLKSGSFILTIFSFLCQLMILSVAMLAFWQRPADKVVRTFCLMCCAWMPAFVGGFHWWVLAASPFLNVPFIIAACLLPAVTLHFFVSFPRNHLMLHGQKRRRWQFAIYAPATLAATAIIFVYWAAWSLNAVDAGHLSVFQKLAALSGRLFQSGTGFPTGLQMSNELLFVLRLTVYSTILLSCLYFGLTVVALGYSLLTTHNSLERSQASGILIASLMATIPIGYTLYLAFFERPAFALGQAKLPMFTPSALFMAAYAHGMLKHRLILANEVLKQSRRHLLMTVALMLLSAVVLAIGTMATRIYTLPRDTSVLLHLALFVILIVGISFVLWARDRIQTLIDQTFFDEKYQIDRTLQRLNQASGYLSDPLQLAEMTLRTCEDVVGCRACCLYLKDSSGHFRLVAARESPGVPARLTQSTLEPLPVDQSIVKRSGGRTGREVGSVDPILDLLGAELLCCLRSEQHLDGLIVVSQKKSSLPFSPEDLAFLRATVQMTELALTSSRANQNLARVNSELKMKMDRIAEQQRQLTLLRAELTALQIGMGSETAESDESDFDRGGVRGRGQAIQEVLNTAGKAARSTATVLIRGESGTGKELMAQVVHRNSSRADKPLVTVNCAALAPSLLESELFGHVKGAFTGAASDKQGRFQAAHEGTLFLDEIGDISPEIQVKLLRVLQERQFEPVGSTATVNVDVRLIAATNRNLEDMIESGEFREDLYYRLKVITIELPSLRERREDLLELVFFFLNRSVKKMEKKVRHLAPEALQVIEQHAWPGNIRELENVIERAVVLAESDTITVQDLPPELVGATTSADTSVGDNVTQSSSRLPIARPGRESGLHANASAVAQPATGILEADHRDLAATGDRRRSLTEEEQLIAALKQADGNKALAARSLNMPRSTFYSKLKKYRLS